MMSGKEHAQYLRDRGTVHDHVIADFIDSTVLKLQAALEERDAAVKLAAGYRMEYQALLKTTADGFMAPARPK